MALHQTGIDHTIVCGGCSHTAIALLHDDCEDKSRVDARRTTNRLNTALEVADFVVGVIGGTKLSARSFHDWDVGREP